MQIRWRFIMVCFAACLVSGFGSAQDLERRVVEHTLENGMKFLLVERHASPTIAFYVFFKVGAVDEAAGKTGLAHLFEHMMFKGTETIGSRNNSSLHLLELHRSPFRTAWNKERHVMNRLDRIAESLRDEMDKGKAAESKLIRSLRKQLKLTQDEQRQWVVKDEFEEIYIRAGASGLNAFTSQDYTGYVVRLPANKLKLWFAMESNRLANPVMREFYAERDVVAEERRLRTETQPGGSLNEAFLAMAFMAHPYGSTIVGWMDDIQRLTADDARQWFKNWYVPNNATAVLVGDFDSEEAIRMAEKFFGGIPEKSLPRRAITPEPQQRGERRVQVEFEASPQLLIGFRKPTYPHPDDDVMDVIDALLSNGRTSRLYRTLVEEKQLAVSVSTSNGRPGVRYDSLFTISAAPRAPHTTSEVEAAIYHELERLTVEPVSEFELEKVRNEVDADFVRGLQSNRGLAHRMAWAQTVLGDWRALQEFPARIRRVTKDDIMNCARRYFAKSNRTVAELVRKPSK